MEQPLVSIIVPVYNGAEYMSEAIDSALAQTYKNIEIIVINDGSVDNGETERIALSYGDNIRYFSKQNGGSSSALNLGIKEMKGEYFSWLSHDDIYTVDKIEKQVKKIDFTLKNNQIIVCSADLIDAEGKPIPYPKKRLHGRFSAIEMMRMKSKGRGINGCCVLIPKEVIDRVGFFDEKLRYVNDTDYWYRLMLNDCIFEFFDERLVRTRIHSNQVSVKKADLFKKESVMMSHKLINFILNEEVAEKKILDIYLEISAKNGEYEVLQQKVPMLQKQGYSVKKIRLYFLFLYGRIIRLLKEIYKRLFFRR